MQISSLFALAFVYNRYWEESRSVEWSEAENLVADCKLLSPDVAAQLPAVVELLEYTEANQDWDSGVVGNWPQLIMDNIIQSGILPEDKTYHYCQNDEKWEVFSIDHDGEYDWAADVSTETLAQATVKILAQGI